MTFWLGVCVGVACLVTIEIVYRFIQEKKARNRINPRLWSPEDRD